MMWWGHDTETKDLTISSFRIRTGVTVQCNVDATFSVLFPCILGY